MRMQWMRAWVLSVAMVGSTAALADGHEWPLPVAEAGPGKTRAEVLAEMAAFKANPVVNGWRLVEGDQGWVWVGTPDSGKTRAEVQAELREFQADAVAQARYAELYGTN